MLADDAPEGAGVGRADGLAFVHDRRRAVQQRRIDDVAVADDPADVGGGPEDFARLDVVVIVHDPLQRHHVAAVVAHDAFRLAGGAGCVEDIERVGGIDRNALGAESSGFRGGDGGCPIDVAAGDHARCFLRTLEQQDLRRLVFGELDGVIEQRLVFDDAVRLDAAGGGEDGGRVCNR